MDCCLILQAAIRPFCWRKTARPVVCCAIRVLPITEVPSPTWRRSTWTRRRRSTPATSALRPSKSRDISMSTCAEFIRLLRKCWSLSLNKFPLVSCCWLNQCYVWRSNNQVTLFYQRRFEEFYLCKVRVKQTCYSFVLRNTFVPRRINIV